MQLAYLCHQQWKCLILVVPSQIVPSLILTLTLTGRTNKQTLPCLLFPLFAVDKNTLKRSQNKNVRFFWTYSSMLIWPTYSDLSRSNFFGQFMTTELHKRVLGGQGPPKENWPWVITLSMSNEPKPTFQKKSDVFILRSLITIHPVDITCTVIMP